MVAFGEEQIVARRSAVSRRRLLTGVGGLLATAISVPAIAAEAPLRFAFTRVLLTSDLLMLEELKGYLSRVIDQAVHLVTRHRVPANGGTDSRHDADARGGGRCHRQRL